MTRLCEDDRLGPPGSGACLYVDAANGVSEALLRELHAFGYQVTWLKTARGVEQQLLQHRYDFLLMRIEMPDLDGMDVVDCLRKGGNAIPVILMSGQASVAERVRALNAGADDVLRTPIGHGELAARIRALLRRSGLPVDKREAMRMDAAVERSIGQLRKKLHGSGVAICEVDGGYVMRVNFLPSQR